MNWFDTSGITSLAKTALKEAQKTIDKALDIQDESESGEEQETSTSKSKTSSETNTPQRENSDFFSSWGLTVSTESTNEKLQDQNVVTESPSKANTQSVWGSFAGSFFEHSKTDEAVSTIVKPPKAKSMQVIADVKYGSQDDLFSKSQLVMSDAEASEYKKEKPSKDEIQKSDERRSSSRSQMLSLVSSQNSSDSVEVLSHSLKTTPDSEAASVSHSSSVGLKLHSESVEILPDSLLSPSSIECLGFDSYSSDKNSSSSNLSSTESDKKSTPVGEKTERAETADSVSLVADDDEDTMSYNSISECTAPTVFDTEEKSQSPFPKFIRPEALRKGVEKEVVTIDQPLKRMQISENSSNDGSWSDRTLNADNESFTLDTANEEQKKEVEQEDMLMEKLSDSSSFYNVQVSREMITSESSAFVNVDKQQCKTTDGYESSSHKDGTIKERISPVSSDSKSDLVKIGSDRTSGHTSGDELETATSSDIEIIPSPNGDNHGYCRSSPAKYCLKNAKFDGTTSPNLVELVLGKSLATKIRGHNRELSEASVQSNTSDESQGSENDRLMRRLCEMAEILEARESRLMEVSRSNAELAECNADLKTQVETLMAKHEGGDINIITEDYTQRMSALEKKFQQAIREKDQLRKQLDTLKLEASSHKNSSALEVTVKEKDEMISQLQEEGEKLAKQQLQHSNIIKKLRAKEKDNEQVIKSLRDKISEQTAELERLKRSVSAKEELEVSQIEAVYRLTTANKKLQAELDETKSALDDTQQRLESTKTSLDAARKELNELQRGCTELQKRKDAQTQLESERDALLDEKERLSEMVKRLRMEMQQEEKRWLSREEALRAELNSARELCATLEARAPGGAHGNCGVLLGQLDALQRAALEREAARGEGERRGALQRAELETALAKARERERLYREELQVLQERVETSEEMLQTAQAHLHEAALAADTVAALKQQLDSKNQELERMKADYEAQISELQQRLKEVEQQLENERTALETEKKRNELLQEQLSARDAPSPPHSLSSAGAPASLWNSEEGYITPVPAVTAVGMDEILAQLQRKEGELRLVGQNISQLRKEKDQLRDALAETQAKLDELQSVQEQYDTLLQLYGEKAEQVEELRLDLADVTQLYKAQLDQLIALKQQAGQQG